MAEELLFTIMVDKSTLKDDISIPFCFLCCFDYKNIIPWIKCQNTQMRYKDDKDMVFNSSKAKLADVKYVI